MKRAILPGCLLLSVGFHALLFTCRFDPPAVDAPAPVLVQMRPSEVSSISSTGGDTPKSEKLPLSGNPPPKAIHPAPAKVSPLSDSAPVQIEEATTSSLEATTLPEHRDGRNDEDVPSQETHIAENLQSMSSVRIEAVPLGENPPPPYPKMARDNGWEGEVLLRVAVGRDGRVSKVVVDRSSGYPVLDRSALKTLKRWRFTPAKSNGEPVGGEVVVPIRFVLERGLGG